MKSSNPVGSGELFVWAAWFGLITGLCESGLLGFAKLALHRHIRLGWDVVWMAPTADALFFAIPALTFFLVSRRWPNIVNLRVTIFTFALLGFLGLLLLHQRLYLIA